MNNNKLKKISKKELLEIILEQAKRIETLEEDLKITKNKLEEKQIAIQESGSLAEAVLKLNGVFESAQLAIDQYILNIKEKYQHLENNKKESSDKDLTKKKSKRTITKTIIKPPEYNNNVATINKEINKKENRKVIKGRPITNQEKK